MNGENVVGFNTNSYISVGIMILIITACIWINNKFNEVNITQSIITARLTSIETLRVTDRWSSIDMFKWAVHLQQANKQIVVPEPKHED